MKGLSSVLHLLLLDRIDGKTAKSKCIRKFRILDNFNIIVVYSYSHVGFSWK